MIITPNAEAHHAHEEEKPSVNPIWESLVNGERQSKAIISQEAWKLPIKKSRLRR